MSRAERWEHARINTEIVRMSERARITRIAWPPRRQARAGRGRLLPGRPWRRLSSVPWRWPSLAAALWVQSRPKRLPLAKGAAPHRPAKPRWRLASLFVCPSLGAPRHVPKECEPVPVSQQNLRAVLRFRAIFAMLGIFVGQSLKTQSGEGRAGWTMQDIEKMRQNLNERLKSARLFKFKAGEGRAGWTIRAHATASWARSRCSPGRRRRRRREGSRRSDGKRGG